MRAKLRLVFEEYEKTPLLSDFSYLLYNLELLYDLSLILYAEEYATYKFSPFFWFRKGRPIKSYHKLRVARIVKESPLTIELIFDCISAILGAIYLMLQIIEKIWNLKLKREKLKLEEEILRIEKEKRRLELEEMIRERKAEDFFKILATRLKRLPFKIKSVEIILEEKER